MHRNAAVKNALVTSSSIQGSGPVGDERVMAEIIFAETEKEKEGEGVREKEKEEKDRELDGVGKGKEVHREEGKAEIVRDDHSKCEGNGESSLTSPSLSLRLHPYQGDFDGLLSAANLKQYKGFFFRSSLRASIFFLYLFENTPLSHFLS